jgi:hypothetical protein
LIPQLPDPKLIEAVFQALKEAYSKLQKLGVEHGNIKASNVFVDHCHAKHNYKSRVLLADACFFNQGAIKNFKTATFTDDNFGFANLMHLLVCGLYICFMPNGKALFHSKVKNSLYFKDIRRLLDGKKLKLAKEPKNASIITDACPSMMEQFPHYMPFAH